MLQPLSFDLRSRVLAAIDNGLSCRQAAARFGVSASSAIRWAALRRAGGDVRPKPHLCLGALLAPESQDIVVHNLSANRKNRKCTGPRTTKRRERLASVPLASFLGCDRGDKGDATGKLSGQV
jgi:transposase